MTVLLCFCAFGHFLIKMAPNLVLASVLRSKKAVMCHRENTCQTSVVQAGENAVGCEFRVHDPTIYRD